MFNGFGEQEITLHRQAAYSNICTVGQIYIFALDDIICTEQISHLLSKTSCVLLNNINELFTRHVVLLL